MTNKSRFLSSKNAELVDFCAVRRFWSRDLLFFQLLSRSTSEEANTRCCGEVF